MNLLLDTHLLLWAAARDRMMSPAADALVQDPDNVLHFSAVSIWEVAIKRGLERPDFQTDPNVLRAGLLANGYREVPVTGAHCGPLLALPRIHRDPFDRMLVAQSQVEGFVLVTADRQIAAYPGAIRLV